MEKQLDSFIRHGSIDRLECVNILDIQRAILRRQDVDIEYAIIKGDLNIIEFAMGSMVRTKGYIKIIYSNVFIVHGTLADRVKVDAQAILYAIAKGLDIDIELADISGDLDTETIKRELGIDNLHDRKYKGYIIEGKINIHGSVIHEHVIFRDITFNKIVTFGASLIKS